MINRLPTLFTSRSYVFLLLSLSMLSTFVDANNSHSKSANKKINRYQAKKLVNNVNEKKLIGLLRDFVRETRPNRMVGSTGHKKAIMYLEKKVKELDPKQQGQLTIDQYKVDSAKAIKLYRDDFNKEILGKYEKHEPTYKKWRAFTDSMVQTIDQRKDVRGHNIIWEKKGNTHPEKIIIIGAHFDTIANDPKSLIVTPKVAMPGADDNGSGVAVALSLIELLAKIDIPMTVRIVFFDWEELGFLGSYAFVQKYLGGLKKENFQGYINLEMLGHDSKIKDKTKKSGNMRLYTRKDKGDLTFAGKLQTYGDRATSNIDFDIVDNGFNSSDHINFWQAGLTAVTFSQDWENDFNHKRYHGPNDFVETINAKTYYKAYQFIANALLGYLFNFKT